ncbi:choline dehydrogenase [Variovorax sp. EBFNA2]|uniref:GMC family oxidoreductase n=1 Tax=Variovorax sp. EBFNA2 TaxID=3342097 RepID=UPI0029C012E9|nr:choline dehydrogenase [Variovorax boronicumulans]WPG41055.1 choline dehydrogenase [Variovorax boronicumulans]
MDASTSSLAHDYVIVGGGSAGCVLANRLSTERGASVLLLEAGPDAEPFWVRTPAGVGNVFFDERVNWKFFTEPELNLAGRRLYWPRGKVMGGSSAINGMVYVRGFASDYDQWRDLGNAGWSWPDVVPYFQRTETSDSGDNTWRGHGGPLRVSFPHEQHSTTDAFVQAGVAAGLARNADIAGATQEGVGYLQHTIGDGLRSSTARAYLAPARDRPNLQIVGDAAVERVRIENGRTTGVEFVQNGTRRFARARKEVLVCAGAIGSPQLLMLSGLGAPEQLQAHGIAVLRALPGVGANLQDHLAMNAGFEVREGASMNAALSGWRKFAHGAGYLLHRRGPLAVGASHAVAFVRSAPQIEVPDIQLSFRPLSFAFDSKNQLRMHPFPGVQFASAMLRPRSRGQITLRSADPHAPPLIQANYLADADDERVMIATLRWIRRIAAAPPLADLVVREDLPGVQVESDEEIMDFVRRNSQTLYHPVGTCAMGTGPQAVVDARLRVHGVPGLRVVDASVMPTIVSGNTNAPTIMIAEKAADMILEDARCSSSPTSTELRHDAVYA